MTGKAHSFWAVAGLLIAGAAGIIVRNSFPFQASDNDYVLTYMVEFHARKPDGRILATDTRLTASIPESTPYCKVLEQEVDAPEMEVVRYRPRNAERRKNLVLRTSKTGQRACTISFRLRLDAAGDWRHTTAEPPLTAKERAQYMADAPGMTASKPTNQEIVNRLREKGISPRELARRIFEECRGIEPAGDVGYDTGNDALTHQSGSPLGRVQAFVTLCRAAKIPARLVTGFEVRKGRHIRPRTWAEVHAESRWDPYDVENGTQGDLPHDFVPVRRDRVDLVRVTNATDLSATYSIDGIPAATRSLLNVFDLHTLPHKLHEPIKVVLVLPIGALLTALVRTVVGIRTFGTFSPTLLALAFVYNDVAGGVAIFLVVLATGFISRTVLDRLKLLLVPRLGIILTMVIMLMVFAISVMNYFDWAESGKTVLLPMVILTNMVERFYVTSEEDNFFLAVRLMINTVLMALAIFSLLNWPLLGNALFDYPEVHFFTVATMVLVGRYTGYRLTELVRFRDLVRAPRE